MSSKTVDKSSADLDAVPTSYEDAVHVLAAAHAAGHGSIEIFELPDPFRQTVRLIEVSEEFPEGAVDRDSAHGAMERVVPVFPMGPARDFPFRSEIVQVTTAEWNQLLQGKLKVNRDWGDLTLAKQVASGN